MEQDLSERGEEDHPAPVKRWWSDYPLEIGETGLWRIGPLSLYARRLENEWRIAYERDEDSAERGFEYTGKAPDEKIPENAEFERYAFQTSPGSIRLTPTLATKSVVTRPVEPFHVPSKEEVTIYVSTPVWVKVETAGPRVELSEIATQRLSDTWFGPSTKEGEFCYATRTACRLRLEEVPFRSNRAITPLKIHNRNTKMMLLKELSIPVPYLHLYGTEDGRLWSSQVTIERLAGSDSATLTFAKDAPQPLGEAQLLSKPRKTVQSNMMTRTLNTIFGVSV